MRFPARVRHDVGLQHLWLGEVSAADVAPIPPQVLVNELVALQVRLLVKRSTAGGASVGLQTGVRELVRSQVVLLENVERAGYERPRSTRKGWRQIAGLEINFFPYQPAGLVVQKQSALWKPLAR